MSKSSNQYESVCKPYSHLCKICRIFTIVIVVTFLAVMGIQILFWIWRSFENRKSEKSVMLNPFLDFIKGTHPEK